MTTCLLANVLAHTPNAGFTVRRISWRDHTTITHAPARQAMRDEEAL